MSHRNFRNTASPTFGRFAGILTIVAALAATSGSPAGAQEVLRDDVVDDYTAQHIAEIQNPALIYEFPPVMIDPDFVENEKNPDDVPPDCPNGRTATFENVAGASYVVGDTLTSNNVRFTLEDFEHGPHCGHSPVHWGTAQVDVPWNNCGTNNELFLNNISVRVDFGAPARLISLRYGEWGGFLQLEVNGDCQIFQDYRHVHGARVGGATISVVDYGTPGNGCGRLTVTGQIDTFRVGGQELRVDDVLGCPVNDFPSREREEGEDREDDDAVRDHLRIAHGSDDSAGEDHGDHDGVSDDLRLADGDSFFDIRADFVRGDCNSDSAVDISDGLTLLSYLYQGSNAPNCEAACDFNDTRQLDLTTAVYFFDVFFKGKGALPAPHPECGQVEFYMDCRTSTCAD